jgi:hypothetical protein
MLCEEWDYSKNKNKPEEYTPGSNKKVWWKCKDCGYEWEAQICNRNYGNGCPECSKSKGEKRIKDFFNLNVIDYISQKEFDGLIGLGGGNLSYDFYLSDYNLLIEYQGEFHDGSSGSYAKSKLKRQLEHDKRKKEYAHKNNITFLEIWYWDYDNIESILNKKLNIEKLKKEETIDG